MTPSVFRSAAGPARENHDSERCSLKDTLPPPEWTSPSTAGTLDPPRECNLPRRTGARAEEGWRRARVQEARAADDYAAAGRASANLARWLASRDRDLGEAVDLAASSIGSVEIVEEIQLRRELSSWLESLGEPGRAAAVLRPIASMPGVAPSEAAYVQMRTGVLKARAGIPMGAAAAFRAALSLQTTDPSPCELLGALGGWAPAAVPPSAAAAAYIEAARRHGALGEDEEELDDLWRASAADPAKEAPARALSEALERRGSLATADEIWRRYARLATRADLDGLATAAPPRARAIVLEVAAERDLETDHRPKKRRPAGSVPGVDVESVRGIAMLSDAAAMEIGERSGLEALERGVAVLGLRADWCLALAETYRVLRDLDQAFDWTRRYLFLRPGEPGALERLLGDVEKGGGSPAALAETLAWLLSQPLPAEWLTPHFASALGALAKLDPSLALPVARRALDVFGAKWKPLRAAVLDAAARVDAEAFTATILERWLACGAGGLDRREAFCRLVDLRERLNDEEGRNRTLAQALREGMRAPELARYIDRPSAPSPSPDTVLWSLHAKAEWLAASQDGDSAARVWRDFGAALWDLADDRMGAIEAWQRAARLAPVRGHAVFVQDLVAFGGGAFAFEYLARLVESEAEGVTASSIAAAAAEAALWMGEDRLAFDLAVQGVSRCPAASRALGIAELASARSSEGAELSRLYDLVAARALGRFGRRAVHYRGARCFEGRSESVLALKHAGEAFQAVPSAGQSLALLARAAVRADDVAQAVSVLEHVAEREEDPELRADWLLQAACLSNDGEEGARRRVDLLFRAALTSPGGQTVALLRDSAQESIRLCPDEREGLQLRLSRAARAVALRAQGPAGARVALAFADATLDLFGDHEGAFALVEHAFACDPGVDEFSGLIVQSSALALASRCRERIASLLAATEEAPGRAGVSALRALAAVAASAGDEELSARAVVAAAASDPHDDDLVVDADRAIRAFPALAGLVSSSLRPERRAEALTAIARKFLANAEYAEATSLFEHALELVDGEARTAIERELVVAWKAAGRLAEVEARAQREAASDETSPITRADRWMEIAERRELRGEKRGAVQAILEACKLDAWSLERWSALERVSEMASDDQTRIMALEHIAACVDDQGRVAVFKRLAQVHARRNDLEATEQTWRRVLAFDPDDEEADRALEAAIVARGRYHDLADHLARRAQRLRGQPGSREVLRAVRLRRAAILEQRLGRVEDACEELERLLTEWPEHAGAIRYLADLLDRRKEHGRAASLWRRAATVEADVSERDRLDMKAARAAVAVDDHHEALRDLRRVLARTPASAEALALTALLSAVASHEGDRGDPLESQAIDPEAHARSEALQESALTAAKSGDLARALDEARLAVAAATTRVTPRLLACAFEYRLRGAGTVDDARRTIGELTRIGDPLGHDDAALRAFLLAEALDVVQGGGAGLHELEATRALVGDHPLLAVGIAERLAAQGQHGPAVDAYRLAAVGPLFDLRKPAAVAMAAADSVVRAGSSVADTEAGDRATHQVSYTQPPDALLRDLELGVRSAANAQDRARARLALAAARLERDDASGAEPLLWEALADGLTEAGDILAPILASLPDRARDLVRVRRQQSVLEPGDVERLESLRAAALADEDHVYADAVDHVLRAFDPDADPLPPPPLASQPEQPGLFALLVRPSMDVAGEAYALLWEGATQLFLREAASYGVSGVERVVPGPSSAIARLYETAMRVLDAPNIPLFVSRRSAGAPKSQVALLSPLSVVLSGEVREESAELRFALGRGMAAALPQNALRLGLGVEDGSAVVEALRTAFGSSEVGQRLEPRTARLAQSFWQMMPPRGQRRLQEILASSGLAGYEDLVGRARQSELRVGLFLSGDFAFAARAALGAWGDDFDPASPLAGLREWCQRTPSLADLLRLAISPEYAEARWHAAAPPTPRGSRSSERIRLF